jgi:CHAT domain-containing protein
MIELHRENPLGRALVAFAGANASQENGGAPQNVLLTAQDIYALDFLRTELVMLPTCDTICRDGRTELSVIGLERSMLLAGSQAMILSLWKVPDRPRQELMEDLCRRLVAGQPRSDALREAQLAIRAKYPHPQHWGAFICLGSLRPLQ